MNKGPWIGSRIASNHKVLILGESHYDDAEIGQPISFTTASVVEHYFVKREIWAPFFDKIAESFGYDKDHSRDFFEQVYFGNYVDVVCGIQDGAAKQFIIENRTKYNSDLFTFINHYSIDIVVCFSKTVYNNLPSLASPSETEGRYNAGPIGGRTNWLEYCNYVSGIDHAHCDVQLQRDLKVYGIRHPSSKGGYDHKQVYDFLKDQPILSDLCRKDELNHTDEDSTQPSIMQNDDAGDLTTSSIDNETTAIPNQREEETISELEEEEKRKRLEFLRFDVCLGMTGYIEIDQKYLQEKAEAFRGHPYEKEMVSFIEAMANDRSPSRISLDCQLRKTYVVKKIISRYQENTVHSIGEQTIEWLREFYRRSEVDVPKEIYSDYLTRIRSIIARDIEHEVFGLYYDGARAEYHTPNGYHLSPEQFLSFTDKAMILSGILDVVFENVDTTDDEMVSMYELMIAIRRDLLKACSYVQKKTAFELEWIPQDSLPEKEKKAIRNGIEEIQKRINSIQSTNEEVEIDEDSPQVERYYIMPEDDIEQFKEESRKRIIDEFRALVGLYTNNPTWKTARDAVRQMEEYYERAYRGAARSIFDYYMTVIRSSMAKAADEEIMIFWKNRALSDFHAEDGIHHTSEQLRTLIDRAECCKNIISVIIDNTDSEAKEINVLLNQHIISILKATVDISGFEKKKGIFGMTNWIKTYEIPINTRQEFEKEIRIASKQITRLQGESISVSMPHKQSRVQSVIDNPIVNAAAAHAVGKAVTGKANGPAWAKNPYAERYAANQKKLDETSGERVPLSRKTCATCAHWCGQRQVVVQKGLGSYVQLPRDPASAKCIKKVRTIYVMQSNCGFWEAIK